MEKYRICENKYGRFKIQMWHPPKKLFFVVFKGKWKDVYFSGLGRVIFEVHFEAEQVLKLLVSENEKNNNEWHEYVDDSDF